MGFDLKNTPEAYAFPNFMKEMFFDSETSMIVISGVPGKETTRGADGKVLEGAARTPASAAGFCQAGLCRPVRKRSTTLRAASVLSVRATVLRIITGTAPPTRPTKSLYSSRWIVK